MRALFKEAAAAAPCLIFVDELDALGKQRSLRISGSNDEVEQTLNQMLACMDGLDSSNNGVVVMGATNRYEILDPALTRPGRFDRIVRISLPDTAGRLAILKVHTRKLSLGPDVDLAAVADDTPSFTGAELAALANEAAIRAVRRATRTAAHPPPTRPSLIGARAVRCGARRARSRRTTFSPRPPPSDRPDDPPPPSCSTCPTFPSHPRGGREKEAPRRIRAETGAWVTGPRVRLDTRSRSRHVSSNLLPLLASMSIVYRDTDVRFDICRLIVLFSINLLT